MTSLIPTISVERTTGVVYLDGSPTFAGDYDDLIGQIDSLHASERVTLVVTPNVDQILNLERDSAFRQLFAQADLRILDGMPLVVLARVLGARAARRLTGADLLPQMIPAAIRRSWSIAIVGGNSVVGEQAAQRLNPTVEPSPIVRYFPLPRLTDPADPLSLDTIRRLNETKPDVVFVCLGSPKQEHWIWHWRDQLPPAVYIGAGAAVDFAAGAARRAPALFQALSIEWLWRLGSEPRRLAHRYLIRGPRFIRVIIKSFVRREK